MARPPSSARRLALVGLLAGCHGGSRTVSIGFIHAAEHWLTLRRAPSPGMHEMSECVDSVGGREILVQTWRTAGGIFRNGRRRDRYDVFALLPVRPGFTVYVTGGGSDRRFPGGAPRGRAHGPVATLTDRPDA